MPDEVVQVELGLEGGGVLRLSLASDASTELEGAYLTEPLAPVTLPCDEGHAIVDLRRVIYIRRLPQTRPVSFRP